MMKIRHRVFLVFLACLCLETQNTPCRFLVASAETLENTETPSLIINIPSRTLTLYQHHTSVKTYPVGVGRPGFPTPLGDFKILRMIKNPGWEHPYKPPGAVKISAKAKGNPLGTRWIGFKLYKSGEYGIHGTPNVKSVGKFSSHGCIRMRIADAEDLFNRVQIGSPVRVTYEIFHLQQKNGQLYLLRDPDVYHKKPSPLASAQRVIQEKAPNLALSPEELQQLLDKSPQSQPIPLTR